MLACVPFLFSIQQFCEGVLWTELAKPGVSTKEQIVTSIMKVFYQSKQSRKKNKSAQVEKNKRRNHFEYWIFSPNVSNQCRNHQE